MSGAACLLALPDPSDLFSSAALQPIIPYCAVVAPAMSRLIGCILLDLLACVILLFFFHQQQAQLSRR